MNAVLMNRSPGPRPRSTELPYVEFAYPCAEELVRLPLPDPPAVDCFDALRARRTSRTFAPMSVAALSTLLWFTARTLETESEPRIHRPRWEHRVTPSAGGRHPVDILISRAGNQWPEHYSRRAAARELWLYDALEHTLRRITPRDNTAARRLNDLPAKLLAGASGVRDATVLWHAAQFARTHAAYEDADSLIWRDVGCLVGMTTVVAAALGLNCCPLGVTGEPHLSAAVGASAGEVVGAGGCVIGSARM